MKKVTFSFISFFIALLMLLFQPVTVNSQNQTYEVDLLAGQNMNIGKIKVWNNQNYLYLKYEIIDPQWCLKETHFHIDKNLDKFPLKGEEKNLVPGQFDYVATHFCTTKYLHAIALENWSAGEKLFIAAHAVVQKKEEEVNSSYFETAWGQGIKFNETGNWGMYFCYTIQNTQLFVPTVITKAAIQTY